jgi:GNAT superfamily N-acetyltransferase
MTEYSWDLLDRAEAPALLEFYQSLYPTLGWSQEFLDWQFYDNPAGPAKVWVARDAGKIVSTYVAIPHQMYAKGSVTPGWRVQDVLTDPAYRGQGIYHQLSAAAVRFLHRPEFPLNFTFPNEQSHNAFVRTGWVAAFRLPLRTQPNARSLPRPPVAATIEACERFDADAERIWHAHRTRVDFAVDRSANYLNWRYGRNPNARYIAFKLSMDGEALLVLKHFTREDGSRWSHLVDVFQTAPNDALSACVFNHWLNVALEAGADSLSCWSVAGSCLEPHLVRAGFTSNPSYTRWLLLNPNVPELGAGTADDPCCREQRWHLAMGDSDVF